MSKANHKLKEFVGAAISRPHFEGISKKEKGITLIALIITIVVMLILVAVTLSVALGENGLVNKANNAKIQMQIETDREELLSAVAGAIGIDGKVDFTYLDSHLPKGFTGSNGTYTSKNGNTFTVSEGGEIKYNGDVNNNGNTEENINIYGKYYLVPNDYSGYIEIRNNNTMVGIHKGEENLNLPVIIDNENQTITGTYEYEDSSADQIVTETIVLNYEYVIENNEITNIILMGEDFDICFQNENGFEYELDGVYKTEDKNRRYTFNADAHTVLFEFYGEDGWTQYRDEDCTGNYFKYKDTYYMYETYAPHGQFDVAEDGNSITIYGEVYTKVNSGEEDDGPIIPYETTVQFSYDGTAENMETWYVVSVDETARTMDIALPEGIYAFALGVNDLNAIENAVDLDGDNSINKTEIFVYSWNHFGEQIDSFFEEFSANFPSNVESYSRNCTYSYSGLADVEEKYNYLGILSLSMTNYISYKPSMIPGVENSVEYVSYLSSPNSGSEWFRLPDESLQNWFRDITCSRSNVDSNRECE